MKKERAKCSVNGSLGKVGKYFAICPHISFGDSSLCTAHGNTKCVHKIKANKVRL